MDIITPDGYPLRIFKMSLSLCNAPTVFQRTVNTVLGNLRYEKTLAYLDRSIQIGLSNLQAVLETLRMPKLTLRFSKCQFFYGEGRIPWVRSEHR